LKAKMPGLCRACRCAIAPGQEISEHVFPGSDRKKWMCAECSGKYGRGELVWSTADRDIVPATPGAPLAADEYVTSPLDDVATPKQPKQSQQSQQPILLIQPGKFLEIIDARTDEVLWQTNMAGLQPGTDRYEMAWRARIEADAETNPAIADLLQKLKELGNPKQEGQQSKAPATDSKAAAGKPEPEPAADAADDAEPAPTPDASSDDEGDDMVRDSNPHDAPYPEPAPRQKSRGRPQKDPKFAEPISVQANIGEIPMSFDWELHQDDPVYSAVLTRSVYGGAVVQRTSVARSDRNVQEACDQLRQFVRDYQNGAAPEATGFSEIYRQLNDIESGTTGDVPRPKPSGGGEPTAEPSAEPAGDGGSPDQPSDAGKPIDPEKLREANDEIKARPDHPDNWREFLNGEAEQPEGSSEPEPPDAPADRQSDSSDVPRPTAGIEGILREMARQEATTVFEECIEGFATEIQKSVAEVAGAGAAVEIDEATVTAIVDERIRSITESMASETPPRRFVANPDGLAIETELPRHEVFPIVLDLASARVNILLSGPSQCGKTTLAEQVAHALGLPFYAASCSIGMSEASLKGRLMPTGAGPQYCEVPFMLAYRHGGVFLLDEIDAAPAEVLLVMNNALSGHHWFNDLLPEGEQRIERHPDFVCIAAANTFGAGANRMYVARQQLDFSTLQRFGFGQVTMDYSERIEAAITPHKELLTECLAIRKMIDKANKNTLAVRRGMTTRFIRDASRMLDFGWSLTACMHQFIIGWSADEIAAVFPVSHYLRRGTAGE
jgi:cobaltochelatase CobS